MSEIKVNKLTPRTNCGTTTLGDSGDTINIPAGVTISNNGTATGFGATGAVNWDVASIKTVDFTATAGVGYFVDTATTGAVDVTLPASPTAGDVVGVSDYAKNFNTANCTLLRNGSNIGGDADNPVLSTDGVAITLVYVDATKGWIVTDSGNQSDAPGPTFIVATGGCITTCGNFKTHTFFSPATFTVCSLSGDATNNLVSYMVVAGGGGSGANAGGGGGAGGFRELKSPSAGSYTASPLDGYPTPSNRITVTATAFPIIVGGGGAGSTCVNCKGGSGVNSTFSTITSAGGGGGGSGSTYPGNPGGSGGGGRSNQGGTGGTGNTPATTPAQGTDGGPSAPSPTPAPYIGGGGGGATVAGASGNPGNGGGGDGAGTEINTNTMPAPSPTPSAQIGTPGPSAPLRYFAGGGGGGSNGSPSQPGGPGGVGGGGSGNTPGVGYCGTPGTINTGGGGGNNGAGHSPNVGLAGGSGIVVIRYKYQ
jgi:hypothetical protein